MKKNILFEYLQCFFQSIFRGHRILSIVSPLLPSPLYGLCCGYWMGFDVGETIQRTIYLGKYEPEQSQWVRNTLQPGGTFLDVGANVGYYTMLAASIVGSNGRVVSFEPSPYAYQKLAAILDDNNITQVSAYQSAVGDKDEFLDLYVPNQTHLHSPSLLPGNAAYTPVKVAVCRLDTHPAVASLPVINLMKVDVEGFEPNVFRGMSTLLREGRVKYLMCEFNSGWLERNQSSFEELLRIIEDLGFVIHTQTRLETLAGDQGSMYRLQDILFQHASFLKTEQERGAR